MKNLLSEIKYYWNRFCSIPNIWKKLFWIALALWFLYRLFLASGPNLISATKARREAVRYEKQTEEYHRQIDDMQKHIEVLSTNRDSIEKVAREKYFLCEPGEDVFIVDE